MKKIVFLIIVLVTALSVTACFRPRGNNAQVTSPAVVNTQTEQPAVPTQTVQLADTATTAPTETAAPTSTPEVVPTATQNQPSAAAASSAQLDQTLNDLEALLNNTNTKIDIP